MSIKAIRHSLARGNILESNENDILALKGTGTRDQKSVSGDLVNSGQFRTR